MEYISGITLKEYISKKIKIDWKESVQIIKQVLKALAHAHSRGIIHRDIKPQNIMITEDNIVKVTDFGIARFFNNETQTMTDKTIGSVHYISPEQAKGLKTDIKSASNTLIYHKKIIYSGLGGKRKISKTLLNKFKKFKSNNTINTPNKVDFHKYLMNKFQVLLFRKRTSHESLLRRSFLFSQKDS